MDEQRIDIVFKGEYLLHKGEICRYQYFIGSGLVKSFHIDSNGQENIHQFGIESWFVTYLESFVKKTPSDIFIQAVEDTDRVHSCTPDHSGIVE